MVELREKEAVLPANAPNQVTLHLTPETERHLRLQASRRGESLETFLGHLAERQAAETEVASDMLHQGMDWLSNRGEEAVRAARKCLFESSPPPLDLPPAKTVLDMVEGKWPGGESDAEIREALERLS